MNDREFAHVMLREIYEQPQALEATVQGTLPGGNLFPAALKPLETGLRSCEKLIIAASGSSRNAGLAGEIMIEEVAGIAVDVEYASEYCGRTSGASAGTVVMVISQSGESADAVAALRESRKRGTATIGITNVADSTIAREADALLLTRARPEMAIPATKSFTTQLSVLYLFALALAALKERLATSAAVEHLGRLRLLSRQLQESLDTWNRTAREAAERFKQAKSFLFIGRGVHYAIAREGALKLKEISYSYAEGLPAGELLHGPNALVGGDNVVAALAARDAEDAGSMARHAMTMGVLQYVKTHGGRLLVVAAADDQEAQSLGDAAVLVPPAPELLLPLVEVVPLQLFAYHVGVLSGCDVDHPRNLVKAVVRT